ncbi:DMT family transporter [Neptunicoccus cionae]|uniref:Multidrug DMT transporter n=1 Tax=Neptunicoccus cionae TaxID=2035344 RepID=A0A916VMX7_9RHOB|nr:DMT family transporter [Amylibacter cionae]GGA07273.1 multidrug DMT transporter [Amylibacter cionae]
MTIASSPAQTGQGRGHLAMLVFSVLVAGSFPLGVRIAHLVDPLPLTALRFVLASVVVGVFAGLGPGIKRSDFKAPWRYLLLGGVFSIYFVLMFEALKTASSVSTAAIFTLTPIMSAVFGYMLLRQITTRWMALALAVGGSGAVWVIFRGDLNALLRFDVGRGEVIFFIACFAHAFYTPLVRRLNRGEHPAVFTLGTLIAGGIILLALSFRDLAAIDWSALPPIFWIGLAYLSISSTAITFFLVQYATLSLPSAKVMAYTYLTPSWVIVWELALGGSVPSAVILIGIAATILALVMLLQER